MTKNSPVTKTTSKQPAAFKPRTAEEVEADRNESESAALDSIDRSVRRSYLLLASLSGDQIASSREFLAMGLFQELGRIDQTVRELSDMLDDRTKGEGAA